jgi:hypothetical protein
MLGQNMIDAPGFEPDWDALAATPNRLVLAAGEESGGTMASRGAVAVAERLGGELVPFPGDHAGFLGGEYGMTGKPDAFAAKLREVLATTT